MYSLLFHMELNSISSLILGRLLLLKDGKFIDTFVATSGAPGYQGKENVDDRGRGPLPQSYDLKLSYTVNPVPISMLGKKGIDGNFYKIDPHSVTINGQTRGDFGVHRDANVPGSAGCIVLPTPKGWEAFQGYMRKAGDDLIPLVVSYS